MIKKIWVIDLSQNSKLDLVHHGQFFYLKTCQRQLLVGLGNPLQRDHFFTNKTLFGEKAYHYLLEVLCGLKSRLTGEHEIVGQFKQAFQVFLKTPNKNKALIPILEKLFKDGKEIRTKHLKNISQLSYSGLARQCLQRNLKEGPLLILGSGQLAKELVKIFEKKYQITICARNQVKAQELVAHKKHKLLAFHQFHTIFTMPHIINTIPFTESVIKKEDIYTWKKKTSNKRLFIDLASPSIIDTELHNCSSIKLLADLFDLGENISSIKEKKIEEAKLAINNLTIKRCQYFTTHFSLQREDRKFA